LEIPSSTELVKVLVIDDDASVRQSISSYLRDSGYHTFEACDGEEGLAMMASEKPELVLCDLRMPKLDGINVLKVIADAYSHVPIIVISGAGVMSDVVEALRLGASDYLIKPILDLEVLEHAIERSLERFSLRRENLNYRQQLEQANSELKSSLAVLEQDQQAGLQVQMKMLPVSPMQKGAYIFQHKIVPSVYLSGDFVEYVTVGNDHVIFFMADVSGHGASSAFVTVLMKNLTARMRSDYNRLKLDSILHPAKFLEQANAELLGTGIGKHATLFFGVIDTQINQLTYSVAGALPVPIMIANGEARYLEGQGAPVGLFEETDYEEIQVDLPERFRIMMFSDGILEVLEQESLAKKEAFLLEQAPALKSDIDSVYSGLNVDVFDQYPDDIALLVVDKI
jgi:serine phosphatase RsbU (regulator of sigma subunit)